MNSNSNKNYQFSIPTLYIPDKKKHSMKERVFDYVEMRTHHLIKEESFSKVLIIGEYDRKNSIIYRGEKTDKLSNWQRPTATIENDTLYLKCFPGVEYVRHYAAVVASYLHLSGKKDPRCVRYCVPSEQQCWEPILACELETVPISDWLILGSGLSDISQSDLWQGNDQYLWTQTTINSKTVTFLVFQFSFWGDILERLVRHLHSLGHERQIFTAKVGGIKTEHLPNESLATGSCSFVDGELIHWDNIFETINHPKLFKGDHINSASVLFETMEWLRYTQEFSFVDSEIGRFARGAKRAGLKEFSYLHFISNRLNAPYPEDLSNERLPEILEKRAQLKKDIRSILEMAIK